MLCDNRYQEIQPVWSRWLQSGCKSILLRLALRPAERQSDLVGTSTAEPFRAGLCGPFDQGGLVGVRNVVEAATAPPQSPHDRLGMAALGQDDSDDDRPLAVLSLQPIDAAVSLPLVY